MINDNKNRVRAINFIGSAIIYGGDRFKFETCNIEVGPARPVQYIASKLNVHTDLSQTFRNTFRNTIIFFFFNKW